MTDPHYVASTNAKKKENQLFFLLFIPLSILGVSINLYDQKSIEISVVDVTFNQADGGINTPDQRHQSFLRERELHS